jgi:hypothetical protein
VTHRSNRRQRRSPLPRLIESLEQRLCLSTVTAIVDDGGAGYADGEATGAPLVATAGTESAPVAIRDSAGNLHAIYDGGGRAMYLFKPAGSGTWTAPLDIGAASVSDPRLAVDGAGTVHVVYSSGGNVMHTYRPAGGSWTTPAIASASSSTAKPAIAADPLGGVHLVYQDLATNSGDIVYRPWSAAGGWGAAEVVANSSSADQTPRIAAGSDGRVSVVWATNNANREVEHRQRSAGGTWGAIDRLDADSQRSLDPDVAMGADNAVHVVWHDDQSSNWEISYRTISGTPGSTWSPITYMTNPGAVDANSRVMVGPDNLPRVSWMDYENVFLARFDGASWTKTIVIAERGATNNAVVVDGFNRTYVLAQVQKAGITNGGTTDLWQYADAAKVVGRSLFYNNSGFDGRNPAANASDDNAIATDKTALLPGGGKATFANYSSYDKGINGVMIDVAGLPSASTLGAADFTLRAGNDLNDPSTWAFAPPPTGVTIRRGAGVGGTDRVVLTWPDYNPAAANPLAQAVAKKWLQVNVASDANTGLSIPDTFYFGNAIGESGDNALNAFVDSVDVAGARDNPRGFANPAPVNFRWDYNRDRFVDTIDMAIARDNATGFTNSLRLITPPAIVNAGGASAWATTSGAGYQNHYRSTAGGDGSRFAAWSLSASGDYYQIQLTWEASPLNGTNVPIYISTGASGTPQVFFVNQQVAPVGTSVNGRVFQTITTMTPSGGVRVIMTNAANGRASADAVRVIGGTDIVASSPGYDLSPDIVSAPNGDLHAVYHAGADTNVWYAYYITKPYGSSTWSAPQLIGGTGTVGSVKIARSPDGTLQSTFHDNNKVWYSQKPVGAVNWTTPVQIPGQLHKALESDLAVDSAGTAYVVWHEDFTSDPTLGNRGWEIRYATRTAAGVWSTPVSASTGSTDDVFPSIAVDADKTAHIAWQNYQDLKLHYRNVSIAGGWSTERTIDNQSKNSNAPDVAIGPDGTVHVAWMERRTDVIAPGSANYDIAYASKPAGAVSTGWTTPIYFDHYTNDQWVDIDPAVGVAADGSIAITFSDYNDAYIVRKPAGGAWSPIRAIYDISGTADQGAKANVLAISPLDNSINVMFMSRTGTNNGSWDVFYYTE